MTREDIATICENARTEWERCRPNKNPMYYKALYAYRLCNIIDALVSYIRDEDLSSLSVKDVIANADVTDILCGRMGTTKSNENTLSSTLKEAVTRDVLAVYKKHESVLPLLEKWKPSFMPQTECHKMVEAILKEQGLRVNGLYIVKQDE